MINLGLKTNKKYPKAISINGMDVVFRIAKRKDFAHFVEIQKSVYKGKAPWGKTAFAVEMRRKKDGIYLVAEVNKRVVAFVGSSTPKKGDLHITNIAVHSDFQKQNIGSYLIDELIEHARENQIPKISLEVRKSNLSAEKFYFRKGFEITGIKQGYYNGDHEDAVDMELILS